MSKSSWVKWGGGGCPVNLNDEKRVCIAFILRDGYKSSRAVDDERYPMDEIDWKSTRSQGDIILYQAVYAP